MLVCYKDIIENINDLMLVIILHLIMTVWLHTFCQAMLCISAAYTVMRWLAGWVSVRHICVLRQNGHSCWEC